MLASYERLAAGLTDLVKNRAPRSRSLAGLYQMPVLSIGFVLCPLVIFHEQLLPVLLYCKGSEN